MNGRGKEAAKLVFDEEEYAAPVIDAEEYARECLDVDDALAADEIVEFITATLAGAGYPEGAAPAVLLDVGDDDAFSGWYEGRAHVIHLHPSLVGKWLVLHELAHAVRPRAAHGPQFCGALVSLVRVALGDEAAAVLWRCYDETGVAVDPWWAALT